MSLTVGSKAPDFNLPSTSGSNFSLSEAKEPVIIYFYPKDFTPGCTKEACSFRDNFEFFKELNIKVLGISLDSISKHQKFKEKHQLPYELLTDASGKVCKAYDALMPIVKIPKRITYLIDDRQTIRGVYDNLFGYNTHITNMIKLVNQELKK